MRALGIGLPLFAVAVVSLTTEWPHRLHRAGQILAAASGGADAIVFGDSITVHADTERVCGRTVNAGVGGATVGDFAPFIPVAVGLGRPRTAVFALGTNDALFRHRTPEEVAAKLGEYVDRTSAEHVIIVGPWPIDPGVKPHGDEFDQSYIDRLNAAYRKLAAQYGVDYIAPPSVPMTTDGVHLDDRGRRLWRENLQRACT